MKYRAKDPLTVEPSDDGRPYIYSGPFIIAKTYREAFVDGFGVIKLPGQEIAERIVVAVNNHEALTKQRDGLVEALRSNPCPYRFDYGLETVGACCDAGVCGCNNHAAITAAEGEKNDG